MNIITLQDIIQAKKTVYRFLASTPLFYNKQISEETEAKVYIKFENHQPVRAFKIRGGLVKINSLSNSQKAKGVCTASTGNHGQSIAYASKQFGVNAKVFAPVGNNPDKTRAMQNLGADIVLSGKDFDEAREACEQYSQKTGAVYIHSANEPALLAGVGTIGLEIFDTLPELDVYINPVGGGSSICGTGIALKSLNPAIKVYGVQAENAPAVYNSFKERKMLPYPSADTFADGLATRVPFEYTFGIMQDLVDDMFLVSEEEMEKAILKIFDTTHTIAEGAGAAATAVLYKHKNIFKGKNVVLLLSGGNLTNSKLKEILNKWS